jgi:putative ABC transport system permease protein
LTLSLLDNVLAIPFLVLLTFFVGLVSSGYSSFYLSSHRPALVLKGNVSHGKTAALFRKALVVLQFSVAVALLIATATIHTQLDYMRSTDPGYDRDQIVVLDNTGREGLGRQWDLLKGELLSHPEVLAVTASNTIPTQRVGLSYINYEGGAASRSMPHMLVDYGYFETYGINLVTGRLFSEAYGQDRRRPFSPDTPQTSGTYIVSELAAAQLGWTPEEALGKWVEVTCCNFGRGVVVGVVENVHYESLRIAPVPVIYAIPSEAATLVNLNTRQGLRQAAIRISGRRVQDTLAHIEASWKRIRPDQPISMHFLDEDFNRLYLDEERQERMMTAFAALAIVITCMGLYGLATYNAQRRTKEIGIRKVMGGSVWSIVMLLTNDFSKLVLLSNVIAWPVAYLAMERWLQNFAYRIDLTPLVFIGSGLIALCIAWVTVGGTAAKAASAKPVLALRYE